MDALQPETLFASLRDLRDVTEKKLRAIVGDPADSEFNRLRALELAMEELNVLWEDLKQRSDSLAGERQRYVELFEHAPDAYLVTDPYGSITEANRAAVDLLSSGLGVLPGKPLTTFVPVEQRKTFREKLIALIADGGARRQSWRGRLLLRSGAELVVEFSVGGVPHPQSGLLRLCWLLRPVI